MLRHWPVLAVIVSQLLVVSLVPAKKLAATIGGTEVTLRTRPVDPYNVLSGYYETLGYEVEFPRPDQRRGDLEPGQTVWIVLEEGGEAWQLLEVADAPPEGRVALRAEWDGRRARLDSIRRFYVPEAQRGEIDRLMRENRRQALVDLRVDGRGNAVLLRLRIAGESFGD